MSKIQYWDDFEEPKGKIKCFEELRVDDYCGLGCIKKSNLVSPFVVVFVLQFV